MATGRDTERTDVQTDNTLLLALLAVRLLGGRQVDAKAAELKPYKAALQRAVGDGYLTTAKIKVPAVGGKKAGTTAVYDLTAAGEAWLKQAPADAMAATDGGAAVAARRDLEEDRRVLSEEVRAAAKALREEGKAARELDKITRSLADLARRVQAIHESLGEGPAEALLARVDAGFASLLARLPSEGAPRPAAAHTPPAAVAHPVPAPAPSTEKPLRQVLREAYDELCLFVEFQDGVVELPRLYRKAERLRPGLTVREFHDELQRLWDERAVELKIRNEVATATEVDKAIWHNERLYYYLLWKQQ